MRFERRGFRGGRGGGFRSGGFRSGGFGSSSEPKPVNVGEEYDVEISETGSRGDGIARVKNFVVFVNGGKKGEKTKIKIKEVRDRFATADKVGEATEAEATEETGEETVEASEETSEASESEEVPVEETSEEE